MFVDEVAINVFGGKGGNGCVSFRREKYVPKGGPDGGNGGKGGNIIFIAQRNVHTLMSYRSRKDYAAENGKPGEGNNRTGRDGEDLTLIVPEGTMIIDTETDKVLADLMNEGQTVTLAQGGRGGKGNCGFVNSIRQAPNFAEMGDIGDTFHLKLELKLVADVALVGYPSVGKSTFISVVSNAKPKIAEYHFTTLVPNLGVAEIEGRDLVFVDVPGLIEGAADGKGLGHTFLRHIERARYVLHLVDANSDTPLEDYQIIRNELEKFSQNLAEKPHLIVLAKADLTDGELEAEIIRMFEEKYGKTAYPVSAPTHEGIQDLLRKLLELIPEEREDLTPMPAEAEEDEPNTVQFTPKPTTEGRGVLLEKKENWWEARNDRLEQMVRQTDITNADARERIYDVMRKWGVIDKIRKQGATPGDAIRIGEHMWEYRG